MKLQSKKAIDIELSGSKAKKFGDKKKNKQIVENECPVCKKVFAQNYQLHVHIRKRHSNYCYSCVHCNKTFVTNNGLYKHNLMHKIGKYQCSTCNKSFHFPQWLQNHERIHVKKKLLKCTFKGCAKKYASQYTLDFHVNKHSAKKIKCHKCTFETDTRANLIQHFHGNHGKGIKSLCGKKMKWPTERQSHQKSCKKCMSIIRHCDKLRHKLSH